MVPTIANPLTGWGVFPMLGTPFALHPHLPMKASYTIDEAALRKASRRSFEHRLRFVATLLRVVGAALVVWSPFYLLGDYPNHRILGGAMLAVGLVAFFRKEIGAWKCAKDALKGYGNLQWVLETREGGLDIDTGPSTASSDWESFVDFKVTPEGILLYPTKQIFYWIPREAEIEDGSWEELCELLSTRIKKRI